MSSSDDYHIFLSYEWTSKDTVKLLYEFLSEKKGFKVWMDNHSLRSGENLSSNLAKGISKSKLFVCCITRAYSMSNMCNNEINFANELRKPIIPLMFERVLIGELEGVGLLIAKLLRVNLFEEDSVLKTWTGDKVDEFVGAVAEALGEPGDFEIVKQVQVASNPFQKKLAWIKSHVNTYFFRSDDDVWIEREEDSFICFIFEQIEENQDEVILFDKSRNMFVKLSNSEAAWGSSKCSITNVFCNGKWVTGHEIVEVQDKEVWKKYRGDEKFIFKTKDEIWYEKKRGKIVRSFKQVYENSDDVVLYDKWRFMYVKLTPQAGYSGFMKNNINSYFSAGCWMKNFRIKSN